jgi:hypothetical protein
MKLGEDGWPTMEEKSTCDDPRIANVLHFLNRSAAFNFDLQHERGVF